MTNTSRTVLIIEDDVDLAELYAEWLSDEYDVRTAYGGKSGLEQFNSEVDLVVLDRRMPNYSGDEVLEDIRSHEHNCPVMMLTAIDPDDDIVDMPFDAYIVKSVDRDELRDVIQNLITKSKSKHNNEILDILGDQSARHCLSYLLNNPSTAKEIEIATEYSLPTVYRRLNSLHQENLIEERIQIDSDGNQVKTFAAVAERVLIDIANGFQIDIEPATEEKNELTHS